EFMSKFMFAVFKEILKPKNMSEIVQELLEDKRLFKFIFAVLEYNNNNIDDVSGLFMSKFTSTVFNELSKLKNISGIVQALLEDKTLYNFMFEVLEYNKNNNNASEFMSKFMFAVLNELLKQNMSKVARKFLEDKILFEFMLAVREHND